MIRAGSLGDFRRATAAGARPDRRLAAPPAPSTSNRKPTPLRDRYGRTKFGQSVLLARRLVEAGVSLVRVNWSRVAGALNNGHWDTHSQNTNGLKQLMPIMDAAYSALLEDLAARPARRDAGRVDGASSAARRGSTAPAAAITGAASSRSALAGGGIRGGMVYGASDSIAAYPHDGRVLPQDLLATIFHCLGISPDTDYHDPLGRPIPLTRGDVIRPIV